MIDNIGFVMILTYIFSLAYIATTNKEMYNNYNVRTLSRRDMKVKDAIQGISNPVMYNFLIVAMMQFVIDQERSMGSIRKLTVSTANNIANTSIITDRKRIGIGINSILNSIDCSDDRTRILADILQMLDYYDNVMKYNSKFMAASRGIRQHVNATVIGAA